MRTYWYVFLILVGCVASWAQSPPQLQPKLQATPKAPSSTGKLDLEFLNQPTFEVHWNGERPPTIQIGDRLSLLVSGIEKPGFAIKLPPGSEVLFDQGWVIARVGQEYQENAFFEAIPSRSGPLTIPSLALVDSQGEIFGRTQPFSVQVADPSQPLDPKKPPEEILPPLELEIPLWVKSILFGVGLLVLGFFVWVILRTLQKRAGKGKASLVPKKVLPEHVVALRALEKLKTRRLWEQRKFKEHTFEISEILKAFFERRFLFNAMESTTSELLSELSKKTLQSKNLAENLKSLTELFEKLDLVKFTDQIPSNRESEEFVEKAILLVNQLKKEEKRAV